jgi:ADP-heptose:LPS heptosyltransferase
MTPKQPTILAIRARQLGDVLVTLGALRAIKQAAPDHRIAFVADEAYHRLLQRADYIDVLLAAPPRIKGLNGALRYNRYVDRLRSMNVECVLDFHSNSRTAILSYLSGAPARIGFDVRGRKLLYTEVEPRAVYENGHVRPRTSHEAATALARHYLPALETGSTQNTIAVSSDDERAGQDLLAAAGIPATADIVGINPGNPYPAKEWPVESFVDLARLLLNEGKTVAILWGPGERPRAVDIAEAAGPEVYVAPEMALHEVPGFLRQLAAVVTIDSGMKHIAVASGVPTVTLFGPTSPHEWHMGGDRDRYVYAELSCSPCRLLHCPFDGTPCMSRLTPGEIMHAIRQVDEVGIS